MSPRLVAWNEERVATPFDFASPALISVAASVTSSRTRKY